MDIRSSHQSNEGSSLGQAKRSIFSRSAIEISNGSIVCSVIMSSLL